MAADPGLPLLAHRHPRLRALPHLRRLPGLRALRRPRLLLCMRRLIAPHLRQPRADNGRGCRMSGPRREDTIRPFPWLTDAPRTAPNMLSLAENRANRS
ncbi:hypothetical protein ABT124_37080 [Streptomyces sp. NPDC001982]|uniref:hypothetical protein n=1 Tax=Streptomyces sp. NPDC001982 TaxID=3154405 RepID=UPI00331EEC4E